MQDRPQVTVSNPNAPDPSLDVVGDDAPRSSRRLVVGGLVLVLLLVAVRGGAEIRERRADAAEERRLQAVVELETTPRFLGQGRSEFDAASRRGMVERAVGLRNGGPRDVTVTAAALGDLRLDEEVVVPAGQVARLLLSWRGACTAQPALLAASSVVELEVRTQAGPARSFLPLPEGEHPPAPEDARRACGYLPLEEAVFFGVHHAELVGDEVIAEGSVMNIGLAPGRLVAVRPGNGLSLTVQTDLGEPVSLPLELPPRSPDGTPSTRTLRLVLRLADCAAVDRASMEDHDPGSALSITSVVGDDNRTASATSLFPDTGPLLRLVEDC